MYLRTTSIVLFLIATVPIAATASTSTKRSTQQVRIGDLPTIPNGIVTPPRAVAHPPPAYTDEARGHRIEGIVTIQAEFDTEGNFRVLRIVRGLGYGLDENAVAALAGWRFLPASRNGVAVTAIAQVDIAFSLRDDLLRDLLRQHQKLMLTKGMGTEPDPRIKAEVLKEVEELVRKLHQKD